MTDVVFSVHTAKADAIGAVEIVFLTEHEARAYALDRSQDHHVLSASVTRFVVGQLGTRSPVAWFVDGAERDGRRHNHQLYPTDGCAPACAASADRSRCAARRGEPRRQCR